MKALAALTVAVMLACSPVAASPVAAAELRIVDSQGLEVGPVSTFTEDFLIPIVMLRVGGRLVRLYVVTDGLFSDGTIMFASPNCTGQAYTDAPPATSALLVQPYALYAGRVYQAKHRTEWRNVAIRSSGTNDGTCARWDGAFDTGVYPAERVMSLDRRWTPPFRIR